jgi:hypothetical protein
MPRIPTVLLSAILLLGLWSAPPAMLSGQEAPRQTAANVPLELALTASQLHEDPFNTVTVDVIVTSPSGASCRVPAFWDGGSAWKVRYASPEVGLYHWRSVCSVVADGGLNGVQGDIEITAYHGDNPLFAHGPIRVASDKRHFEHADGTPFFWLGDTWWMGLCNRLHWPDEFAELTADRRAKGFTVIQIVAGLYPDMPPFDPRGANEAGFPWEKSYARIRPEYFDAADRRLEHLVEQGLAPCIVGAWGYFLPWLGVDKAKQHWRYLIARYGAYPVIWCVAGEANLPWYLAKGFPYDDREQVAGWTQVARALRAGDPFHRLVTIHPTGLGPLNARHAIDDAALIDFDMLQTPHGERNAIAPTYTAVTHSWASQPTMPTLDGEASYEMLMDRIGAEWPRAMFWLCMMNGAAGHTYGANGIWQCNRKEQPHGKSPHGGSYGVISWDDAMRLPGSRQIGQAKTFIASLPWPQLAPLPGAARWADRAPWGDWIWFNEGAPSRDAPVAARYFRRSFSLPAAMQTRSAVLQITADDRFTAWLNGTLIGTGESWEKPARFEVGGALRPGANVLAVSAENLPGPPDANPAGLIASLAIISDGVAITLQSDASWRVAKAAAPEWQGGAFDDSSWPQALVAAPYGAGPWHRFAEDDPAQGPYVCGIADRLRLCYCLDRRPLLLLGLPAEAAFTLTYFDPVTGERSAPRPVSADHAGGLCCPAPPGDDDWAVLVERAGAP